MSVDGFIAHDDDSVGHLFDWYGSGEAEVRWPGMGMVSHVAPPSAAYLQDTIKGGKTVALAGPSVIQQALDLDLVDEIAVELAPVLLGKGIRFFGELAHAPVLLDDPQVTESTRVSHLRFRVRHQGAGAQSGGSSRQRWAYFPAVPVDHSAEPDAP